MIKYGVEFYELVYPKWAKIRFKISDKGKFLFILNPSLTPGKLPDGITPGVVPKGTKIFDYSKENECILDISVSECLKIIDFAKSQNLADSVKLLHSRYGQTKTLTFTWGTGKSNEIELCNINYLRKGVDNDDQKIYVPVPFTGLREIVSILNSYVSNFVMIKTMCLGELLLGGGSEQSAKTTSYKAKDDVEAWDEEEV